MVIVLENSYSPEESVRIDGYIPSLAWLQKKVSCCLTKDKKDYILANKHPRDYLFMSVLDESPDWYHYGETKGGRFTEPPYYFWLTTRCVKKFPSIRREIEVDSNKDAYRALIALRYSKTRTWSEEIVRAALRKCGFSIKGDYQDKKSFIQDVRVLLKEFMSPWIYPCFLAENILRMDGFKGGRTDTILGFTDRELRQRDEPWRDDLF